LEKQQLESKEGQEELLKQQQKIKDRIESFQTLYDSNQKMLSFGRKTNELFNRFFQTGNKKQLISEFSKWSLIEKTRFEEKKMEKIEAEMLKKNDEKERPLSKRERTRINKQLKLEEEKKRKALKELEKKVIPEIEKVRQEKKKEKREKAIVIEGYQFKVNDIVRLKDGNAKGSVEKIEKNIATINYGMFTAKTDLDQLELVKKG
jgi:DNA mismatch repair protein MutS2